MAKPDESTVAPALGSRAVARSEQGRSTMFRRDPVVVGALADDGIASMVIGGLIGRISARGKEIGASAKLVAS
jgi:hypothetical protein